MIFDGWTETERRDHRMGLVIALVLAFLALCISVGRAQDAARVVPDPALTPGVIASTDEAVVCATGAASYSKQHRQTSAAMKSEVRQRYGMERCGEIDHRLPLAIGGADAVENLWCQPGGPEPWGYKLKDHLEVYVWEAVCKHHTMTLAQGQAIFMEPDWREPYCALIGGEPCPVQ